MYQEIVKKNILEYHAKKNEDGSFTLTYKKREKGEEKWHTKEFKDEAECEKYVFSHFIKVDKAVKSIYKAFQEKLGAEK